MSTDASQTSDRDGLLTRRRSIAATAAGGLSFGLIGATLTTILLIGFGPEASSTTAPPVLTLSAELDRLTPAPDEPFGDNATDGNVTNVAAPQPVVALQPGPIPTPDASEPVPPESDIARTVSINRGDTLMVAMVKAGADRTDAYEAIKALASLYNPRRLQPGQELTLTFEQPALDGEARLTDVSLNASVERDVVVRRTDDGDFVASEVEKVLEPSYRRAEGRIDSSLYLSAVDVGVPVPVLAKLIRIFSYDVDFQRDIHPGDSFAIFYESLLDENGEVAKHGEIEIAQLTLSGKEMTLYRFELPDGTVDYFNEKGESVRKALMKTPIDGARLSSGYGMRHHPILGYSRMHKGTDFAAPRGTPIMAAGDGVIEIAKRYGSYGNYVRIRHNSKFKTAYAHLSRFGKGIRSGARVQQGEIIGYVGTTGRSTGPHLHYEVLVNNRQVNPMGLDLPTGKKLAGKQLTAFLDARRKMETRMAAAPFVRQVAQGN